MPVILRLLRENVKSNLMTFIVLIFALGLIYGFAFARTYARPSFASGSQPEPREVFFGSCQELLTPITLPTDTSWKFKACRVEKEVMGEEITEQARPVEIWRKIDIWGWEISGPENVEVLL